MSITQRTKVFQPDLLLKLAAVLLLMALLTSIGTWVDDRFVSQQVMQALPLLAWLLMKRPQRLRHVAITTAAAAWTAVTVWLLQRALNNTGFL